MHDKVDHLTDDEPDVGVVFLPSAGHEGAGSVVKDGAHLDLHVLSNENGGKVSVREAVETLIFSGHSDEVYEHHAHLISYSFIRITNLSTNLT